LLAAERVGSVACPIAGEPTTAAISAGVELAKAERCDCVVGFGGGSAVDAAKAIAALLTNDGPLLDYLEVIGEAQPLTRPAAPCVAVPTTAGTGAEVTRNAVLASPPQGVKVSLRSPLLLPRVALVDPELTYELPPALTATTGLDALTQLIEPFLCNRANPLTDAVCVEGVRRVARSLRRAFEHGSDAAARADMAVASLFGGLALANAGLGAVHGFAGPIGGRFPAPHGTVCAALLPHVLEVNARALRERQPQAPVLGRFDEVARLLTDQAQATAADGVAWLRDLSRVFGIPGLRAYGVAASDFPGLIASAARASSMQANPLPLTPAELREILERAW
jgi:alcohol dehydrogenase class IV